MLRKIVLAVLVGIIVFLACTFLGGLLATVSISWIAAAGSFFVKYAALISLVAALWYFFAGGFSFPKG